MVVLIQYRIIRAEWSEKLEMVLIVILSFIDVETMCIGYTAQLGNRAKSQT